MLLSLALPLALLIDGGHSCATVLTCMSDGGRVPSQARYISIYKHKDCGIFCPAVISRTQGWKVTRKLTKVMEKQLHGQPLSLGLLL